MNTKIKREQRRRRHKRVRAGIKGTAGRPRLSVFKSNKHVWVQLVDDVKGHTLVSAFDGEISPVTPQSKTRVSGLGKTSVSNGVKERLKRTERARRVGELLAQKAGKKGINAAVFDRGGYKYHGRVKAVAEGAREKGLRI